MKKKQRHLYFFFWFFFVMGFVFLLGTHLYDRFNKSVFTQRTFLAEKPSPVHVVEEKQVHPEEVRPLPDLSSEELAFRERATRVLEGFPRKAVLKEKERDFHKPPPELIEASAELGTIEDLLDKNPALTEEGLRFYRKCALTGELLTPLKALCLHNLKTRAKKTGVEKRIKWNEFPDHLHRIADKL